MQHPFIRLFDQGLIARLAFRERLGDLFTFGDIPQDDQLPGRYTVIGLDGFNLDIKIYPAVRYFGRSLSVRVVPNFRSNDIQFRPHLHQLLPRRPSRLNAYEFYRRRI